MPADQQSLRRTCGRFVIIFISFMTKRAKLASSAFRHYTSKARSAQVQCVLLVTVLLQILLRANDIEMNPGPSESETVTDMKVYMQDLFEHQEVRIQTLLQQQLNVRFGVLENHLTEKIDESMTAVKTEIEALHAKTCQLENYCCAALQETESTKAAVTELEDRLLKISADLDDKIDRLEVFSRRDNLKFFNVPMSVSNENYADRVEKIVDILSDTVPGKTRCPDDITRAYRLGNSYNNDRAAPVIVTFAKWSDKMAVLTKGREGLKRKGVRVAGDLTRKQQANIQEQRDRGMHAYYKGNRLVVAGPLQRRLALQRGQRRHSGQQRTAVRTPTPADGHSRRKAVATEQETSLVQEPGNTTTATTRHVTPTAPDNTTTATSHAAPTTPGNTTTARTRCGATTIATTITTGTKPTPGRPPCTTSRPYKGTETPQMATTPTTCSVFPWLNNNNSQLN